MLSVTSSSRKQPLSLRSSVRKAIPASIATPGLRMAISRAPMAIVPDVAGDTPNSVSATLLRPEPTRPARPRISPSRRSNRCRESASSVRLRHRKHDVADRHALLGKHLGDFAPDHQLDDFVARHPGGGMLADETAIAKHRHLVGDLEQLVHLVGDIDDARPCGLQRADDPEEMRDLALGQRGGRLVHDQNVGIVGHRLGDFDHLPVGDAEVAHFRFRDRCRCRAGRTIRWCAGASPRVGRSRSRSAARGGSRCFPRPS